MLRLEDALDALHELEGMRRFDDDQDRDGNQRRYDAEYQRLALSLVDGLTERLPLTAAELPWWLGLIEMSAAEAARDLSIPRRTLTTGGSLSGEQLGRAATHIGRMLLRKHGRSLRRYADALDWLTPAGIVANAKPAIVAIGWRAICREAQRHDEVLALLTGQLPYDASPSIPAVRDAFELDPLAVVAPAGVQVSRRLLMTCPSCGTTWHPRVPRPVKCPECQHRFGWPA